MNTYLYPSKKPNSQDWYTSNDLTDIEGQLGYSYGLGSLDLTHAPLLGSPDAAPLVAVKRVHNISRAQFARSFVIRTYARGPAAATALRLAASPSSAAGTSRAALIARTS